MREKVCCVLTGDPQCHDDMVSMRTRKGQYSHHTTNPHLGSKIILFVILQLVVEAWGLTCTCTYTYTRGFPWPERTSIHQRHYLSGGVLSSCMRSKNSQRWASSAATASNDDNAGRDTVSTDGHKAKTSTGRYPALPKSVKYSVFAILVSSFLNLLGFTMASPLTPTLGQHFDLPVGATFGTLTSAYPLGMLAGVYLWPSLSDKVGRKVIMVLSLFGSGFGLSLQACAVARNWSLQWFLATRVLTGCFAGSSPVAKAYLADLGSKSLPKFLAWRDAASTLAYIVGPALGGILFETCRHIGHPSEANVTPALASVIAISAVASAVAATLIGLFVENTKVRGARRNTPSEVDTNDDKLENFDDQIVSCPLGVRLWTGVATACVVSFLYHIADSTFFAFFPSLLQKQLSMDTRGIGLAFTLFACMSFSISSFSLSSRLISKVGVVQTCAIGLSILGTGLGCLASSTLVEATRSSVPFVLGAAGLYFCGVPLYGPTIPTMLLQCVSPNQRGRGKKPPSISLLSYRSSTFLTSFLKRFSPASHGYRWGCQHNRQGHRSSTDGSHLSGTRCWGGLWNRQFQCLSQRHNRYYQTTLCYSFFVR